MIYDVVIVGGGPAGLMAAIAASEYGASTLLIDKGNKLGRKLEISGGGRCNVTSRLPREEIIRHIPGNGKFLYSAFSVFDNEDIIEFFENLGIRLKEEDHGRMFPESDSAKSVVQALLNHLESLQVQIKTNTPVQTIHFGENYHTIEYSNGNMVKALTVVIAVGGKSVPHTGSTGDGYPWAKKAGHSIIPLFPTEVPLVSHEPFIKEKKLQGLSLRDIALTVLDEEKKPLITHKMDMVFTHFGISGPAVLRCSQFAVKQFMKTDKPVLMKIDSLPEESEQELLQRIVRLTRENPKKSIRNLLKGIVPERYLVFLLKKNGLNGEEKGGNLSSEILLTIVRDLKGFVFKVHDSLPIEKAFVTGGGVSVKEIVPNTMASKKMHGLYFCGEILDIHGYTGGFNITAALVTGRIAGMNACFEALSRN